MAYIPPPTYATDTTEGREHYLCLLCGHEATDRELFTMHMLQRHAGTMTEGVIPEGFTSALPPPAPAPVSPPVAPVSPTAEHVPTVMTAPPAAKPASARPATAASKPADEKEQA